MSAPDARIALAAEWVTPVAVSLGNPEPGSTWWTTVRRAGITGTDVAKILGYSKYGTARTVWHDKHGELPEEDAGEAAEWGNILEPVIAAEWMRRHGGDPDELVRGGILACAAEPWMRAQVDYLMGQCPDEDPPVPGSSFVPAPCALEVKTRSAFVASRWGVYLPDDVLAQVAWQRMVTGLDHVHVACLVGGQELIDHTYTEDAEVEDLIRREAAEVWRQVTEGTPPAGGESPALVRALDRMYAHRAGSVELSPQEHATLSSLWAERARTAAAADAADAAMKVALLDTLQGADVATWGGEVAWSYRPSPRRSVSLRALEDEAPELYAALSAAGRVATSTSRRLHGPQVD